MQKFLLLCLIFIIIVLKFHKYINNLKSKMLNHLESYSVILPTYNECGHIEDLTMDIFNIFKSKNLKFEIIIVDDESEDGTFEIVQKLDNKYPEITAINRKNKKRI